jgi:tRNA pseudouridine38-40 synthase
MASGSKTLKLTLEYDGTEFFGWQVQPDQRTVQGEVERALADVTQERVRINGASRTDAGVHATGQVASFESSTRLDAPALKKALNAVLAPDVAVTACDEMPAGFHARFSASGKHYRYRIVNRAEPSPLERRAALHVRDTLDVAAMHDAAQAVVGEHDFRGFETDTSVRRRELAEKGQLTETASVRRVHAVRFARLAAHGSGSILALDIAGTGFLYNMIRALVGTLLQVGRKKRPASDLADIVNLRTGAERARATAGPTSPPQGLCLMRVFYGEEAVIPALGSA